MRTISSHRRQRISGNRPPIGAVLRERRKATKTQQEAEHPAEPWLGIVPVSTAHRLLLDRVHQKGLEVLNTEERLFKWIHVPFWGMNISPVEMMTTFEGTDRVLDHLIGLEFGSVV